MKNVLSLEKKLQMTGLWSFELGIESGKNIPSWVIIGFMADNKFDSQLHDNSVFDWLPYPKLFVDRK